MLLGCWLVWESLVLCFLHWLVLSCLEVFGFCTLFFSIQQYSWFTFLESTFLIGMFSFMIQLASHTIWTRIRWAALLQTNQNVDEFDITHKTKKQFFLIFLEFQSGWYSNSHNTQALHQLPGWSIFFSHHFLLLKHVQELFTSLRTTHVAVGVHLRPNVHWA